MIAVALVVALVVAGAAAYFLVAAGPASTTTGKNSTQTTARASSSTSHASISAGQSSARTSTTTGSSGPKTSSSTLSGGKTYSGTFSYSLPLGPSGELVYPNGTVKTYTSVQAASGSFTFSIDPTTYSGSGSGQGTLTVTTNGFCSGRITVPYTFQIPDATNLLRGNTTVFIGNPTPASFTQQLTCTATPSPGSATTNTFQFLAIYPNEINVVSIPVTVTQHLSGNITYQFTINPAG